MVLVECPWCDGSLPLDSIATVVRCDGCDVVLEMAPDPVETPIVAVAA